MSGGRPPDGRTRERFPEQVPRDDTRIPTLAAVLALGRRPGAEGLRFNIETKLNPLAPEETAGTRGVRPRGGRGAADRGDDWEGRPPVLRLAGPPRGRAGFAPELATVCLTVERRWHDNLLRGRPGPSPWTAGLDIEAFGGSVPRLVEAAGCAVWSPFFRDVTESVLAEAHALGLRVVVWTVNEVEDMLALARLGVDGVITDYPDRAVTVLAPWRPAR